MITSITGKEPYYTCGGQDGYFTVAGLRWHRISVFYDLNGVEVGLPFLLTTNIRWAILWQEIIRIFMLSRMDVKVMPGKWYWLEPPKPIITNIKSYSTLPRAMSWWFWAGRFDRNRIQSLLYNWWKRKEHRFYPAVVSLLSNLKAGSYSNIYVIKGIVKKWSIIWTLWTVRSGISTIVVDIKLSDPIVWVAVQLL